MRSTVILLLVCVALAGCVDPSALPVGKTTPAATKGSPVDRGTPTATEEPRAGPPYPGPSPTSLPWPTARPGPPYPGPPTETPLPTPTPMTPTPAPTLSPEVHGRGNFPRMVVVGLGRTDGTLALYLVEGDGARRLVLLDGTDRTHHRLEFALAPGAAYVAYWRELNGPSPYVIDQAIEVLRVKDGQRWQLATTVRGRGRSGLERPAAGGRPWPGIDQLTAPIWLDAEHVAYTVLKYSLEPTPLPGKDPDSSWRPQAEVWAMRVDGQERRLLATAPLRRLLGSAPDGQTLYVTRSIPQCGYLPFDEGFALLRLATGEVTNLWPQDVCKERRYSAFTLVTPPGGTQQVLYTLVPPGDTCATSPSTVWLGDVQTGDAAALWTDSESVVNDNCYGLPMDYQWSPHSARTFLYRSYEVIRVDLDTGQWLRFPAGGIPLLWAPEGIVMQEGYYDHLTLRSETGELLGEMSFAGP